MTPHKSMVANLRKSSRKCIKGAGGETMEVKGEGEVTLLLGDGREEVLHRVQLVLDLGCPLLSVSRLEDMGLKTTLSPQEHSISCATTGRVVMEVTRQRGEEGEGGLYYLPYATKERGSKSVGMAAMGEETKEEREWRKWHSKLGHLSRGEMEKLYRTKAVRGMEHLKGRPPDNLKDCFHCSAGKQRNSTFKPSNSKRERPLDLLHMDLMGPLVKGVQGHQYLLVVVDDHTRYTWVRFLKAKSDAAVVLKSQLFPKLETMCERHVKAI
jgi:hypothetical protein